MSETTKKKSAAKDKGFSAEEKAAMKERAKELKAAANKEELEKAALKAIAEMSESERTIAERIHAIVKEHAPELSAKTMYGMPAYANAAGKVVFFYQAASKFDTRYGTLGFNDIANLDDGDMFPASYAIINLTPDVEKKIAALVKKAVS